MSVHIDLSFLLKAIKENYSFEISYIEDNRIWKYTSRFLKLSSDGDSIIIELPVQKEDTYKPLDEEYLIEIYYKMSGFRFWFKSRVKEMVHVFLESGIKVPALKILWPKEILDGNQRSFYRIELILNQSISVLYRLKNKPLPFRGSNVTKKNWPGVEAMIMDVSEDGIAIRINGTRVLSKGDGIILSFQLKEMDNQHIEIEGIVKNVREYSRTQVHICGIQFLPRDTEMNKKSLQKISLYVMSREKQNINFLSIHYMVSNNPIIRKIVMGEWDKKNITRLVEGKLKVTLQELLEGLVFVCSIDEFKRPALNLINSIPLPIKKKYIERFNANLYVVDFLLDEAIKKKDLSIAKAIILNPLLPIQFTIKIAKKGNIKMLRIILSQKGKLIVFPRIIEAMIQNPNITPLIKKLLKDIQMGFLKNYEAKRFKVSDELDEVSNALTKQRKSWGEKTGTFSLDEVKNEALSTLQKVNRLNLKERIKLAYFGTGSERMVLTKDPNKFVQLALVESPKISKEEITRILQNIGLHREVVAKISRNSHWMKYYPIVKALSHHPKASPQNAMSVVKRLNFKDQQLLLKRQDISPHIKKIAEKLLKKKNKNL